MIRTTVSFAIAFGEMYGGDSLTQMDEVVIIIVVARWLVVASVAAKALGVLLLFCDAT